LLQTGSPKPAIFGRKLKWKDGNEPSNNEEIACGTAGAPDFFERYSEEFDPRTGMGGIDVWIPVKS